MEGWIGRQEQIEISLVLNKDPAWQPLNVFYSLESLTPRRYVGLTALAQIMVLRRNSKVKKQGSSVSL